MNKKLIAIIILMFILLATALTCPKKQAHQEEIKATVSRVMDKNLDKGKEEDKLINGFALFVGTKIVEEFLETKLKVNNYMFFSIGEIYFDGKTHIVSLGILNHVFTLSEKDVNKFLEDSFK